jgi:hypothetical protein
MRAALRVLALLALALGGAAAPCRARDVLEIPPSCGSESELVREIDALRSDAPQSLAPRPEVQLTPEADAYVLRITLPDGARTLRDRDCRALFRAAIVIAALGHEPEGALAAEHSAAPSQPAPPEVTAPMRPSAPPPPVARAAAPASASTQARTPPRPVAARSARAAPPTHVDAFAQVEAAYGTVPAWSAALAAGASVRRGLWGGRIWFGYLTPRTHSHEQQSLRIQGLDLGLSLELAPLSRLAVGLGADLFFLRGQGLEVTNPSVDWTVQPALHLGLRVRVFSRARLGLELTGRALWSPQPSSFALSGGDTLYTSEAFAFQLGLAGSFQFL